MPEPSAVYRPEITTDKWSGCALGYPQSQAYRAGAGDRKASSAHRLRQIARRSARMIWRTAGIGHLEMAQPRWRILNSLLAPCPAVRNNVNPIPRPPNQKRRNLRDIPYVELQLCLGGTGLRAAGPGGVCRVLICYRTPLHGNPIVYIPDPGDNFADTIHDQVFASLSFAAVDKQE